MFFEPKDGHGLKHNPFNALVVPRPIGWISTRDKSGVDNLAPYSFFNAVAYAPPQVMFSSTGSKSDQDGTKDTVANIHATGVFCVNIVGQAMVEAMNVSSAALPYDVDEFNHAGLKKITCTTINCARVVAVPAALECKVSEIVPLRGAHNTVVFGEVTGIYMEDAFITEGKFDITKFTPVGRLGYRDYANVKESYELLRPDDN
ncbi:MAG: flavin reductase [Rhodobacteraceae bacterium]|nr:flavin reductase [Paracoccaceae bacterium]